MKVKATWMLYCLGLLIGAVGRGNERLSDNIALLNAYMGKLAVQVPRECKENVVALMKEVANQPRKLDIATFECILKDLFGMTVVSVKDDGMPKAIARAFETDFHDSLNLLLVKDGMSLTQYEAFLRVLDDTGKSNDTYLSQLIGYTSERFKGLYSVWQGAEAQRAAAAQSASAACRGNLSQLMDQVIASGEESLNIDVLHCILTQLGFEQPYKIVEEYSIDTWENALKQAQAVGYLKYSDFLNALTEKKVSNVIYDIFDEVDDKWFYALLPGMARAMDSISRSSAADSDAWLQACTTLEEEFFKLSSQINDKVIQTILKDQMILPDRLSAVYATLFAQPSLDKSRLNAFVRFYCSSDGERGTYIRCGSNHNRPHVIIRNEVSLQDFVRLLNDDITQAELVCVDHMVSNILKFYRMFVCGGRSLTSLRDAKVTSSVLRECGVRVKAEWPSVAHDLFDFADKLDFNPWKAQAGPEPKGSPATHSASSSSAASSQSTPVMQLSKLVAAVQQYKEDRNTASLLRAWQGETRSKTQKNWVASKEKILALVAAGIQLTDVDALLKNRPNADERTAFKAVQDYLEGLKQQWDVVLRSAIEAYGSAKDDDTKREQGAKIFEAWRSRSQFDRMPQSAPQEESEWRPTEEDCKILEGAGITVEKAQWLQNNIVGVGRTAFRAMVVYFDVYKNLLIKRSIPVSTSEPVPTPIPLGPFMPVTPISKGTPMSEDDVELLVS